MIDPKTALATLALHLAQIIVERDQALAINQQLVKRIAELEPDSDSEALPVI